MFMESSKEERNYKHMHLVSNLQEALFLGLPAAL